MSNIPESVRQLVDQHAQPHLLSFWDELTDPERSHLAAQIQGIDFSLTNTLTENWIDNPPKPESFDSLEPVTVMPIVSPGAPETQEALKAGEQALRDGRVGLVLVAGGQGTRLGFDGPKGSFPIGPVTGRTLFEFHADKIHNANRNYDCTLPWYIMVGETNEAATIDFFEKHNYFDLGNENVTFFKQNMMPCVGDDGKFFLETKDSLAMNPNGHGGCIPALMENGIIQDAEKRGVDTLSYFQVDNWTVKLADPYFIGCHVLQKGEISSKVRRKIEPREAAGVFCVCDGQCRVIEYTELDIYPELMETDSAGNLIHFASNAAIHVLDVDFIKEVYERFTDFPWHCSHKKIPYINAEGLPITPNAPNGYKFETFIFDAIQYTRNKPVILEIDCLGEFSPTKQMTGSGSVENARADMTEYWTRWLRAAGCTTILDGAHVEINPRFAFSQEEFVEKASGIQWPSRGNVIIGPAGELTL